jgi:polysaccharide biosynthesis/export protein
MNRTGRRVGGLLVAVLNFGLINILGCVAPMEELPTLQQAGGAGQNAWNQAGNAAPSYRTAAAPRPQWQVQQTAYRTANANSGIVRTGGTQIPGDNAYVPNGNTVPPPAGQDQQGPTDPSGPPLGPPGGPPHGPGPGPMEDPGPRPMPTELVPSSHAPYRVAPPDILLIDAMRVVPKGPYRLEPLETLMVNVSDTLPGQPITNQPLLITPEGTINLGYNYGTVRVGGLTLEQAQQAIYNHLSNILKNPTVNLAVTQFRGLQQVAGQHLVRPDGTISLGTYGSVYVSGLTLGQVKCVLERYLAEYLVNPQVSVDVLAYNSQKIYLIYDGGGYGQQIVPLPVTGNETVLDAISSAQGLAPVSSKRRIWVARPSPCNQNCNVILPVDWEAITMNGQTCTNYQLFAGDRVYIDSNPLIRLDNRLAQILSPYERVLGALLLTNFTIRSFQNNNNGNSGLFVP